MVPGITIATDGTDPCDLPRMPAKSTTPSNHPSTPAGGVHHHQRMYTTKQVGTPLNKGVD